MARPSNKSFGTWCEENNLTYMIDLWDNKLNKCSPYDIAMSTAHKYYFKCNRGIHESELTSICNITGEKHYRVHCRKCNSFGQWCIDNSKQELLNRWDKKLNNLDPFDVPYGSGKKYWFILTIPNGKSVANYGYYTTVNGVKWYLVTYKDTPGFVSSRYLVK